MFEKIRKMKNKKGFTLVELIVVLVILAILAALLVPALAGYIDKAKEEKIIAETRMTVMAAQTEVDEAYAIAKGFSAKVEAAGASGAAVDKFSIGDQEVNTSAILTLAEVKGAITEITVESDGHIAKLTYKDANGKTCTYTKATKADAGTYKAN